MSDTTYLQLPYLAASQAQKHVTLNEALSLIDSLVHLAVKSRVLSAPPATPGEADRFLVAPAPTGLWAGYTGKVAIFLAGAWRFLTPREGWRMWVDDENLFLTFDGAAWISSTVPTSLQNMQSIGINATADVTNKLSVNSSAVLFNNIGNGTQVKVNKNSATDSASFLFQTGFSGRAEFGTTGDDNFHFKVSADGTTYTEAFTLDAATGRTEFKKTAVLSPQAADPTGPLDGQLWYNSTAGKFRGRQAGATVDIVGAGGSAGAPVGSEYFVGSADTALSNERVATATATVAWDLATAGQFKANVIDGAIDTLKLGGDITAAGKALLDDANAAAQRSTLGLGTAATSAASTFAAAAHTQVASTITDFNAAADLRIAAASVNALSDVSITAPATGQVLKFNGAAWVNDVDATSAGGGGAPTTVDYFVGTADAALTVERVATATATITWDTSTAGQFKATAIAIESVGQANPPTAPAANTATYSAVSFGGRVLPVKRSAGEAWRAVQSMLMHGQIGYWQPQGNATTVPGVTGFGAPSVIGTATSRIIATSNRATRLKRIGYVSAATAAALAGHYQSVAQLAIGNGTVGGFHYVCRFLVSDAATVAGARMFVGLRTAVVVPTNVEPNSQTNVIGVAQLSTSNNLHIVFGGSAAQTAIDLGANFPANTLSADTYELSLYSPPGSVDVVWYRVERIGTSFIAQGQLGPGTAGVTIPLNATLLAHTAWRSNNATLLAVGLDIASIYTEQMD